jgi:hypothetical protein
VALQAPPGGGPAFGVGDYFPENREGGTVIIEQR